MNLSDLNIDNTWSLFLDRDGVINERIVGDYVRNWEQFKFLEGAAESLSGFHDYFQRVIIVTNQQGVAKGLMTHQDVRAIHNQLLAKIDATGGDIDNIYYAPYLAQDNHPKRKPNIGMALAAQTDFPDIVFEKSIMVGDSISDLEFGRNAGMKTVWITGKESNVNKELYDLKYDSLYEFYQAISK